MDDRRDDLIAGTLHHAANVASGHGLVVSAMRVLAAHFATLEVVPAITATGDRAGIDLVELAS